MTKKLLAVCTLCMMLTFSIAMIGCSNLETANSSNKATTGLSIQGINTSAWNTLGDVLAFRDETKPFSASYNEFAYNICIVVDDHTLLVKAKMTPEIYKEVTDIDYSKDDAQQKEKDIIDKLELDSITDITNDWTSDEDLAEFIGKTGKDLEDAEYKFAAYYGYGGDETYAYYEKGYCRYNVVFDTTVKEKDIDDEGKSLKDAKIIEISYDSVSDSALSTFDEELFVDDIDDAVVDNVETEEESNSNANTNSNTSNK